MSRIYYNRAGNVVGTSNDDSGPAYQTYRDTAGNIVATSYSKEAWEREQRDALRRVDELAEEYERDRENERRRVEERERASQYTDMGRLDCEGPREPNIPLKPRMRPLRTPILVGMVASFFSYTFLFGNDWFFHDSENPWVIYGVLSIPLIVFLAVSVYIRIKHKEKYKKALEQYEIDLQDYYKRLSKYIVAMDKHWMRYPGENCDKWLHRIAPDYPFIFENGHHIWVHSNCPYATLNYKGVPSHVYCSRIGKVIDGESINRQCRFQECNSPYSEYYGSKPFYG